MPRGLNTFTTCAGPDKARPHEKLGGLAGLLVNSWLSNGFLTVTAIVLIVGVSLLVPILVCVEALLIVGALKDFKRWYYHERLLCIKDGQCSIGTVVSPTSPAATDGDMKLNLLLAPYTKEEAEELLFQQLEKCKGMLSDANHSIWSDWNGGVRRVFDNMNRPLWRDSNNRDIVEESPGRFIYVDDGSRVSDNMPKYYKMEPKPVPTHIEDVLRDAKDPVTGKYDRAIIQKYMGELKGIREDAAGSPFESNAYNQITLGVVDTLLQDNRMNANSAVTDANGTPIQEPKNYQQHYYRMDKGIISDNATQAAIPVDYDDPTFNWQQNNAHRNFSQTNPQTGATNENLNPLYRFGFRDEESDKSVYMLPYFHCEIEGNALEVLLNRLIETFTAFTIGCALGGPLFGAALGALIYFLKWLFDKISGNDGRASQPDVNWDDPAANSSSTPHESGADTVIVYGNWIMDTEHHQYFEIHPVKAYYILQRHTEGNYPDFAGASDRNSWDSRKIKYPIEEVTRTVFQDMCKHVRSNEPQEKAANKKELNVATAMSYGLKTQYG